MYAERSNVPDAGRPQFLPPEEPPPDPPPAETPPPAGDARLLVVAVAGGAAVVVIAAVGVLLHGRSEALDTPSLTAPVPSAGATAPPAYINPPDPCKAPGKAVPADMRSVKPRHVADACHWELLRTDKARDLTIEITLEPGEEGTSKATGDFAADFAYTGDRTANGGFERDPEHLGGLGDEAFAAHSYDLVEKGPDKKSAITYDLGGVRAETRLRNVLVTVSWQGADYPARVRGGKKLTGTRLAYPTAKKQAAAMLRAVLAGLR
jgi:hypothetical protein